MALVPELETAILNALQTDRRPVNRLLSPISVMQKRKAGPPRSMGSKDSNTQPTKKSARRYGSRVSSFDQDSLDSFGDSADDASPLPRHAAVQGMVTTSTQMPVRSDRSFPWQRESSPPSQLFGTHSETSIFSNASPWAKEEDEFLRQAVLKYGPKKWTLVASEIPGRNPKQCRDRWNNHVDPHVKKTPWEPWEDEILMKYQIEIGNKWSKIARLLPGRSDNAIKNRFYSLSLGRSGNVQQKGVNALDEEDERLAASPESDDLDEEGVRRREAILGMGCSPAADDWSSSGDVMKSPILRSIETISSTFSQIPSIPSTSMRLHLSNDESNWASKTLSKSRAFEVSNRLLQDEIRRTYFFQTLKVHDRELETIAEKTSSLHINDDSPPESCFAARNGSPPSLVIPTGPSLLDPSAPSTPPGHFVGCYGTSSPFGESSMFTYMDHSSPPSFSPSISPRSQSPCGSLSPRINSYRFHETSSPVWGVPLPSCSPNHSSEYPDPAGKIDGPLDDFWKAMDSRMNPSDTDPIGGSMLNVTTSAYSSKENSPSQPSSSVDIPASADAKDLASIWRMYQDGVITERDMQQRKAEIVKRSSPRVHRSFFQP